MTTDNLQQFWDEMVLSDFQGCMTSATFDTWLVGSRLLAQDDNKFTIQVNNEFTRNLLNNKYRPKLCAALQPLAAGEPQFEFVVAASSPAPAPITVESQHKPVPILTDRPVIAQTEADPNLALAHQVDFEHLWQKSGFSQIPDYAAQFYRIHLGRAFDLWEFLISLDKRDVRKMKSGDISYWTPPRKFSYRQLAAVLRCGRKTLTGRLVPCWTYERQKRIALEQGQPPPPALCCGKYEQHRLESNRHHEYVCSHWQEGLLERLSREGLIAVKERKTPGKPRAAELHIQTWRLLPILTPAQVEAFPREIDQIKHRHWLERYGPQVKLTLSTWEKITASTLVPLLPGYDNGREFFEMYRNNPLAD